MNVEQLNNDIYPFARLMGVRVTRAEPELVEAELHVRADLCTSGERIHGGAIMAFADTLGGIATTLNLPDDATGTATIESKTNFFRAATVDSTVTARTVALHLGRTTHVLQTTISSAEGKTVAMVTQTQIVLR